MLIDASQVERQPILCWLRDKEGYTVNDLHEQLSKVGIDAAKNSEKDIDFISTGASSFTRKKGIIRFIIWQKIWCRKYNTNRFWIGILHFIKELLKSYTRQTMELVVKVIKRLPKIDKRILILDEMIKERVLYWCRKRDKQRYNLCCKKAIKLNKRVKLKYHSFNRDETMKDYSIHI